MNKTIRQLKHSLKLISQNKTRSILTVLGVILATLIYTLGMIYVDHSYDKDYIYYKNFPEDSMLLYTSNPSRYKDEYESLKSNVYYYDSYNFNYFNNYDQEVTINITGVEKDYLDYGVLSCDTKDSIEVTKLFAGRSFDEKDMIIGNYVAHIPYSYAKLLFKDSEFLGKTIKIKDRKYMIVGILQDTPDVKRCYQKYVEGGNVDNLSMSIYIPDSTYLQNDFNNKSTYLIFRFDNNQIQYLSNDCISKNQILEEINQSQIIGSKILNIILYSILTFSAILISIIMMFNIKERVFEIGIKMAIGARKDDIRFHFLLEGFIYGLIGSIIGISLGCLLGIVYCIIDYQSIGELIISISIKTILIPFASTISIVTLGSLIPAIYASKINIINCLKVD